MLNLGLGTPISGLKWMDGQMDKQKDGQTSGNSLLCPTGYRLFGAAAQKGNRGEGGDEGAAE